MGPKETTAVIRRTGRVVYFIQAADGLIKIGIATDPLARMANLKTANPRGLTLLGVIQDNDPDGLERHLHHQFRELGVGGEWFRPDAALRYFIEKYTIPHAAYQQRLVDAALAQRGRTGGDVIAFPQRV